MNRLYRSLAYRWKRYRLGLWSPFRKVPEGEIRIAGEIQSIHFPEAEAEVQGHELHLILLDDCYQLAEIDSPINTVVDVGGNMGLFSIAALNRFRPRVIHTYEPNSRILSFLEQNLQRSCFQVFGEAVGASSGTLSLRLQENSLHTTLVAGESTSHETIEVPVTAFDRVLERIGGSIDLLKLDCEGAEWELLDNATYWPSIQNLTMEYHLWARPGSSVEQLTERLQELGFTVRDVRRQSDSYGLLIATRT